jgi:hypothetical protein
MLGLSQSSSLQGGIVPPADMPRPTIFEHALDRRKAG